MKLFKLFFMLLLALSAPMALSGCGEDNQAGGSADGELNEEESNLTEEEEGEEEDAQEELSEGGDGENLEG